MSTYVDFQAKIFQAKIFPILYPPLENSTTCITTIKTEPEENFCKICKKAFKSKGGFKNHMKNFHPHSCPRCTKDFKENTQLLSHLKNNPNCKEESKKVDESKKVVIKREREDEMKEESENKPKKLKVCPCLPNNFNPQI